MSAIAIVLLFVVVFLILVAVMWVMLSAFFGLSERRYASPMNASHKVTEPCCGSCGYPTRGLGSLDCPECGADLREAGILTPALVSAIDNGAVGCAIPTAWTVGLIVAGYLIDQLLTLRLPSSWAYSNWYDLILVGTGFGLWIVGLIFFSARPKRTL